MSSSRVGVWELVRPLSEGGQASVWEARGPDGRRVALKRINPEQLLLSSDGRARFSREAALLAGVEHPGLVRLLDSGEAGGVPFLVYELLEQARPLDQALGGRGLRERVGLVRDAARAVGALHARGIAHRDLTPGNVLVDAAGRARVSDLGLASDPAGQSLTRTGAVLGTPGFIAPEVGLQGSREAGGPRADVWALGLLLWQAVAGAHPFAGLSFAQMLERLRAQGPPPLPPAFPARLDQVCRRALCARPEDRFPNGEELARALDGALASISAGTGGTLLPRPGTRIGRWELLQHIGQGGMGSVWRARDPSLGRDVALKLLPFGATDQARERFVREAQAASRVRHPALVPVHEVGELEGMAFLAMDLVEGETLAARLSRGPFKPPEAALLVARLSRGVAALHAAGVLHRDVKPGNVILDHELHPHLVDLGVAFLEDRSRLTRTGQAVGTPLYMPPEQLDGHAVDPRVDVYALGALLYEALTGVHPWVEARTPAELLARKGRLPQRPSSRVPDQALPPALEQVCMAALSPDPDGRPPSAAALAEALEGWSQGRATRFGRPGRRGRRVALGLAAVAGLGVAAAVLLRPEPLAARLDARLAAFPAARLRLSIRLRDLPVEEELVASLAEVGSSDPAPVRASAERLWGWVGLSRLAQDDAAGAEEALARAGSKDDLELELLRAGLLVRRDPSAGLEALARVEQAGVAVAELHAWRIEAHLARGLVDEAAARQALAAVEQGRSARLDPRGVESLRAAALFALGRLEEGESAYRALAEPPPMVRWERTVALAADAFQRGREEAAWKVVAAAGQVRPAGPPRERERWLVTRALERANQVLAEGPAGSLGPAEGMRLLEVTLRLNTALLPSEPPSPDLARLTAELIDSAPLLGHAAWVQELAFAALAAWPEDGAVALAAARLVRSGETPGRYLPAAEAAARLLGTPETRALLARGLSVALRYEEAARVARQVLAEAPAGDPATIEATIVLARAERELGRPRESVDLLRKMQRGGEETIPGELELELIRGLRRLGGPEAVAEARSYLGRLPLSGREGWAHRTAWWILARHGEWKDCLALAKGAVERDEARGQPPNPEWLGLLALARAESGDFEGAAAALLQHGRWEIHPRLYAPEALAGLRTGQPEALALLRAEMAFHEPP